ncbi:TPA: hypothetical protein DEA21_01155 [Candidatus Uhrbacteria bacterium]|nr:hypothetical protein [Candidatus Uhrbacteria bacterium]HCU32013.1 hypothetical protein [Candidatus Uhrbacteria bacterium]
MAADSGNFAVDEIIKFGEGVVSFYDFVFYFVEALIYSVKSFINILEKIVDDIKPEINVVKVFFEYHSQTFAFFFEVCFCCERFQIFSGRKRLKIFF